VRSQRSFLGLARAPRAEIGVWRPKASDPPTENEAIPKGAAIWRRRALLLGLVCLAPISGASKPAGGSLPLPLLDRANPGCCVCCCVSCGLIGGGWKVADPGRVAGGGRVGDGDLARGCGLMVWMWGSASGKNARSTVPVGHCSGWWAGIAVATFRVLTWCLAGGAGGGGLRGGRC